MQLQATQNIQQAIHSIQALPLPRQQQIFDFIDMVRVYETQVSADKVELKSNINAKAKQNAGVFSDVFGMVKAKKSATLEEMDEAIKQRGAGLLSLIFYPHLPSQLKVCWYQSP